MRATSAARSRIGGRPRRAGRSPSTASGGITNDAKGQRVRIEYSENGSAAQFVTTYQYDDKTFRLKKLVSTRVSDSKTLQDLAYTYDPVGNIVQITDDAQQDTFFNTPIDVPANKYTYDAVYRLIQANGREHQSNGVVQLDNNDCPIRTLPDPNDPTAVRQYTESYQYDPLGNITELFHNAGSGAAWTRAYNYPAPNDPQSSNRLMSVSGGGTFSHDAHGNMTSMPHLAAIDYSPFDQMSRADLGGGGDAYYVYGADGQRVRKVHQHDSTLVEERIYLGGYEIYRKRDQTGLLVYRETLHVMDGVQRIAMVETKTVDAGAAVATPTPRVRFQLGNHLGSALLEVDEAGWVISYEEYHPYGTNAYRSARGGVEVSARRYRYTGKERDEESGLYYHGARYYACWLARWTSADPMGIGADGPGLYSYVRGSPVGLSDPSGMVGASDYADDARRGVKVPAPSIGEEGGDLKALADAFAQGTEEISEARQAADARFEAKARSDLGGKGVAAEALAGFNIFAMKAVHRAAYFPGTFYDIVKAIHSSYQEGGAEQVAEDLVTEPIAAPFSTLDRAKAAWEKGDVAGVVTEGLNYLGQTLSLAVGVSNVSVKVPPTPSAPPTMAMAAGGTMAFPTGMALPALPTVGGLPGLVGTIAMSSDSSSGGGGTIGSGGGTAGSRGTLGERVSQGHAFGKHVVERREYEGLRIATPEQFAKHIDNVVENATGSNVRNLREDGPHTGTTQVERL